MNTEIPHSIELRIASEPDTAVIAGFNQAMAMETESKSLDDSVIHAGVAAVLNDSSKGFYLVADVDGQCAACLMITFEWSDWRNAWFWWIQSVYVEPSRRRMGLYRRLYAHARGMAREHGNVCGFRLYAETDNRRAHQAYRSLGMKECGYQMFEEML